MSSPSIDDLVAQKRKRKEEEAAELPIKKVADQSAGQQSGTPPISSDSLGSGSEPSSNKGKGAVTPEPAPAPAVAKAAKCG